MSDITYNLSYRVQKGALSSSVAASNITATMSQTGLLSQTLAISTNAASITTANLASVGLAYMQNISTATVQTVTIGIDAGGGAFAGFSTLRAGESALLRLAGGQQYLAKGAEGSRLRVDVTEG